MLKEKLMQEINTTKGHPFRVLGTFGLLRVCCRYSHKRVAEMELVPKLNAILQMHFVLWKTF